MVDIQSIKNQFSLIEVAQRYVQLIAKGSEYRSLCPFHDDHNPSCQYFEGDNGTWVFFCQACGAGKGGGDVIDFVSLIENVDLKKACEIIQGNKMPELGHAPPRKVKPSKKSKWIPVMPVPDDAPPYDPKKTYNPNRDQVDSYQPDLISEYLDAEGRLLCYVIRQDVPNTDRKITPTITYCKGPKGEHRWCSRRMDPPTPLLGLDLLAQKPNNGVLLVSGEKCWEVARKHFPALIPVTWIGGDRTVEQVDISPLKGRYICYMPDRDQSGQFAMLSLYNRIERE